MCDHAPNREAAMTRLAPGVWCDPCIAPLIDGLNAGGITTVASCCGHGRRPASVVLDDGNVMLVMSRAEHDRIGGLWPGINDEPATATVTGYRKDTA